MLQNYESKYYELLERCKVLELENSKLKQLLKQHDINYQDSLIISKKHEQEIVMETELSLDEKVELFRSLFIGREDVFAKRWYSPTSGKSGYQPVCEREWNNKFCDKKKYKCTECPNRKFAILSNNDIYNHLEGKDLLGRDVIGIYAIKEDNTCHFLYAVLAHIAAH